MGKYTSCKVAGYWLYYTNSCKRERIVHVHANTPTTDRKGAAKIWVHDDGTSTVAESADIKVKDLKEIQQWIYDNFEFISKQWLIPENMEYKNKEGQIEKSYVTDFFQE